MNTKNFTHKSTLVIMLIGAIFTSCTETPSNTAKVFLEAVRDNKFEKAKSIATKEIQENLSYTSKSSNIDSHRDRFFNIVSEKIDGDIANVNYEIVNKGVVNPEELIIRLVKEDGKWLVSSIDAGKRERESNRETEHLKIDIKSLNDELNTYDERTLSSELRSKKLELTNSLKVLNDSLQVKLSFAQQIKLDEDIKQTMYFIAKFKAEADEFKHSK